MTRSGTNDSGPGAGEPAWLVALGGGRPRSMSLDELDAAFRDGVIDEATLVWSQGMPGWKALGDVIGSEREDDELGAPLGLSPEPVNERMDDDEMPKVDPRLWALSDEAGAVRRSEAKYVDSLDDETTDETELGAEDLDDDETPCGIPPQLSSVSVFTPGSFTPRAASPQSMPPQSVPPSHSVPPRVSAVSRVPPPPRSRTLPPVPKAFDTLPPPVMNIATFESTAPLVRTLSEPVIPIQPPPPGWNWRPWAAGAGAIFGMSLYGLSVLDLAAISAEAPQREAAAAAAELKAEPEAASVKSPPAPRESELRSATADTPVTAAVMPRGSQAIADDVPSVTPSEPERRSLVSSPRKKSKKASRLAKKAKRKVAKSKASTKSRSKQPAWLAKFKKR